MIRNNGDAIEAITLMVAGLGLTVLIALAMDRIEIWWKTKRGA
jgi:hypothetical protein